MTLVITLMMAVPATANYVGVRSGLILSATLTVGKLVPLVLLIVLGLWRFSGHAEMISLPEIQAPGWKIWIDALFLLVFAYSGFEDSMAAAGEVKNPRRVLPFGLIVGLAVCVTVYTFIQFIVVATTGTNSSPGLLSLVASTLIGRAGAILMTVTVMISTYGYISGTILNGSRFPYALASKGELPKIFRKLHPAFNTPHISILIFVILAWIFAVTGSFRGLLAITAGSAIVYYGLVSLALIRLRQIQPDAAAFRLPLGSLFSLTGAGIALILLTRLQPREILLMGVTAAVALLNWWWVRNRRRVNLPLTDGTLPKTQSAGN